jgi:predicted small secreted protein
MKRYWKAVAMVVAVVLTTSLLSCNTMRGLGRDIERGGEEIQDATRD